jgi:hypothetical protein
MQINRQGRQERQGRRTFCHRDKSDLIEPGPLNMGKVTICVFLIRARP